MNFLTWTCWNIIAWPCLYLRFRVRPIIPTLVPGDYCGKFFCRSKMRSGYLWVLSIHVG
jgi:hypothetical protein